MPILLSIERDPRTNALLSVYYRVREGHVARTVELDDNCLLDVDDINRPIGLEVVGPFSLAKARAAATLYASQDLEVVFAYLAGERELVGA